MSMNVIILDHKLSQMMADHLKWVRAPGLALQDNVATGTCFVIY